MSKNLFGISDQLINDVKSVLGEKLTGGQKNLDVDKDGKIEASDFKKLRNKKLAAKMKKPEADETAAHEKKEHSGPCSADCDCMKEEVELEESVEDKHFSSQSKKMQDAINLHLRNGKSYQDAVAAAKVHVKEEVELEEGDPIVRTKSFPGEPPEGTYADMRRKGTLPKPIQAKDKEDTPPWSGPSKKVPVGTVPSKSHRQKLARSGIPMKEDAIEESKQYIEVVDVSGQKKKVAVEAGKAFDALNHYRKQPNIKSARIVSEEADLEEKHLTPAEMKKREEIAKAMERENPKMPMGKKMAIATATAKKVAEEVEISEKVEVTIKKKTSDEPNVSKRDVSYDVYHDGKYHRTFKDINDAMDHKEKMQKEEVELDEGDDASKDALAMKINAKNAKRKYADKALKMFRNELVRKKEKRLNKEEYSIDEARGRPKKVKPGEEAADNEGDDTGSIVMKLRKASSIGKPVQFKDSSTHNISKSDARKALAKHDALRTSIEKEKLADRMHASHASFKDVLAGKGEPEEMTLMQKIKAARAARQ